MKHDAPPTIYFEDTFHATLDEMERGKESRFWREIRSWVEERRVGLADQYDAAADESEVRLIQRERRVLQELLELPDLVIAALTAKAAATNKEPEDARISTN